MTRKKWIVLAVVLSIIALLAWLVSAGVTIGGGTEVSGPPPVVTVNDSTIPPAEGLVESATGIVADGPVYVPTAEDIEGWLVPLIAFDPKTQTYDEWQRYVDENVVFSAQDFPRESVDGITPDEATWDEGWRREFKPMASTEMQSYEGQGGAVMYAWVVGGDQMLYSPDGEPWMGSYTEVNVAAQCAGSTPDTCRILSYDSLYPIYFEKEKGSATP